MAVAHLALVRSMKAPWDDDEPYDFSVWVESTKSLSDFEAIVGNVIAPVEIHDHKFAIGESECTIRPIGEDQPPSFPGVPVAQYGFRIDVPTQPWDFWGSIDRIIPFALSAGLRGKFSCKYLITADDDFFVLFSGTNQPRYYNSLFPPFGTGELGFLSEASEHSHAVPI